MNRAVRASLALLVVTGLIACETRTAEETGTTETEAGSVDPAAVEAEIDARGNEFERAIEANDADAVAVMYADDAILLPPNAPRVTGMQGIRASFAEWLEMDPDAAVELTADEVVVAESGELAYEIGTAQVSGSTPDGGTYEDTGKYLVVWENEGGEWMMVADMWSSDAPAPGMEGSQADGSVETEAEGSEDASAEDTGSESGQPES